MTKESKPPVKPSKPAPKANGNANPVILAAFQKAVSRTKK